MLGVTFVFFTLSAVLFFGTFHYIIAFQKPGFYPPKKVLKKRIGTLAGGGVITLLLGIILSSFQ